MQYHRRLPKFEYLAPKTMEEAISMLGSRKGEVRIIAGGTIVVHQMKERIGNRPYLMSLKLIKDLDYIQSIADSSVVNEKCSILANACRKLGTPQLRNMGTIGGNLSCRFATAESIPVLIALGAEVDIVNGEGNRTVLIEDFYKEMKDGELLAHIRVPSPPAHAKWGYQKFAVRDHYDFATVSAATLLNIVAGKCTDVRLALGGVTLPTMRAKKSEDLLSGQAVTDDMIVKAAQLASESCNLGSDVYFSADYKKELLRVVAKRALKDAVGA
jgi:carbon-monoxide dehydrogenase medium subunit